MLDPWIIEEIRRREERRSRHEERPVVEKLRWGQIALADRGEFKLILTGNFVDSFDKMSVVHTSLGPSFPLFSYEGNRQKFNPVSACSP